MGSQGNYPGSGAINAHKHLAMKGDTGLPHGKNMDSRLKEGGEYGLVGGSNMESVSNSEGSFEGGPGTGSSTGSVRGNAP